MSDRIVIKVGGVEQVIALPDDVEATVDVDLGSQSTSLMHLARAGTRKGQPARAWVAWDYGGDCTVPEEHLQEDRTYLDRDGKRVRIQTR